METENKEINLMKRVMSYHLEYGILDNTKLHTFLDSESNLTKEGEEYTRIMIEELESFYIKLKWNFKSITKEQCRQVVLYSMRGDNKNEKC